MTTEEYIAENERRRAAFRLPYDPIAGIGCADSRIPVEFSYNNKFIRWNIPSSMMDNQRICNFIQKLTSAGSAECFIKQKQLPSAITPAHIFQALVQLRCRSDFEFWTASCAKIQDKETGAAIPFVLNPPQRKFLAAIIQQQQERSPVRIIVCKARQWGSSTFSQIYIFWRQALVYQNYNGVIIAENESQCRNILNTISMLAARHPADVLPLALAPFMGSAKHRLITASGSVIYIGSMNRPDSLRSSDIKAAHFTEVGLWKKTLGKSPLDLVQSITSSVLQSPDTIMFMESTAKGVGNFFYNAWTDAEQGRSNYAPVFVGWQEIPLYQKEIDTDINDFIRSFNEYEQTLWLNGATLEGINWYRGKLRELHGDQWLMNTDFPTTPQEAFTSGARRVFAPYYVRTARQYEQPPLVVGELCGMASKGKDALKKIAFTPDQKGCLQVWRSPDMPLGAALNAIGFNEDITENMKIKHRYCGFLDIGGRNPHSDYSVLTIIDRLPMLAGLPCELAARWRGRIGQDLLAWKSAAICRWYEDALLAVEINSLERDNESEGEHSLTILDEIKYHYDNLYRRTPQAHTLKDRIPSALGFATNAQTKGMIIDALNAALRDGSYIERDREAFVEFDCYEYKDSGRMGNTDGQHDDIVISTAGAVWLAINYMEKPQICTTTPVGYSAGLL